MSTQNSAPLQVLLERPYSRMLGQASHRVGAQARQLRIEESHASLSQGSETLDPGHKSGRSCAAVVVDMIEECVGTEEFQPGMDRIDALQKVGQLIRLKLCKAA
jgi:hypothetical protein